MDMQNYLGFLTELNQALDTLTALEQRKLKAVQDKDLQTLDQCMKQEQAAALDLRGREHKRNALLKELGLEQVSLRDLPSHCPPQYKRQATEISQQVLRSYQVLSSTQQAARTLMESNVRHIQQELERRETEHRKQPPASKKTQTDFRA